MEKVLQKEWATYQQELPNLLKEEGRFVLIHEDKVIDTFSSREDAIRDGYRRFGVVPILVHQILRYEKPLFFSRRLVIPEEARLD